MAAITSAKESLRVPSGADLPQSSATANAVVRRHVYESLKAGKMVCHEGMERLSVAERRANNARSAAHDYVRRIAQNMKNLGEGVGDVSLREYSGSSVGEDGRERFVYFIPSDGKEDTIVALDREVRKVERDNENPREKLGRARGVGVNGGAVATAMTSTHPERLAAVKMGASIVRHDNIEASGVRNVNHGSAEIEGGVAASTAIAPPPETDQGY